MSADTPRKVVVADADEGIRALVNLTLSGDSFEVFEATAAEEALVRVAATLPQLVVVDGRLPGASGVAIARSLKAQPETRHIRVVLLFDKGEEIDQPAARANGVDAFLAKPFNAFALLRKVHELLGA